MIKSNNLMNNALAMQEALRRGAFEGVMRNYRGELTECTNREPLRRERRGRHDAAARCRNPPWHHAGIHLRDRRTIAVDVREAVLRDDDLYGADEAFLTSTTREAVPIQPSMDVQPETESRPLTLKLLDEFRRVARTL
jgi:branched-chain amino acid aminotransferase